jgi:hypothetical protein
MATEAIPLGAYRAAGEGLDREHATAEARNGDVVIVLPNGTPFHMTPASARTWAAALIVIAETADGQARGES